MENITLAWLDKVGACGRDGRYRDEVLQRWWPGRKSITPLELANDRRIPCCDRVWVLCRACPEYASEFAGVTADRVWSALAGAEVAPSAMRPEQREYQRQCKWWKQKLAAIDAAEEE
jgi:hypothetical protein